MVTLSYLFLLPFHMDVIMVLDNCMLNTIPTTDFSIQLFYA